jgi:hypothetical protein
MEFADSSGCCLVRGLRTAFAVAVCWLACGAMLWAGNPRWVTGPPYFTTAGVPVVWYTNQPLYFTDPGDLSSSVDHAAADALVAAAAAVWNVPTASLVLGYGGALSEHVSEQNAFASTGGVIFPADVQSSNYLAKQIAVLYDTDGSVTDLLLGNGASDPSGCRQNAVTESVDSIVPAGFIQHAILVLNGRCTGPAPEQQLQMQYQLMRAFGRVLGMGWSQTNDNVFTGAPQPTYNQALHWPVMHPIDIVCGDYTYQCMPEPFMLRPDDLSTLAELYFIAEGTAGPGKVDSLYNANQLYGQLSFPTRQGMKGVNTVGRRWAQFTDVMEEEDWYTVSSVTGFLAQRAGGNAVTGAITSEAGSMGSSGSSFEGYYELTRVPMLPGGWQDIYVDTEPVNPLYTGQYSVGPYLSNTVEPSGSDVPQLGFVLTSYTAAQMTLTTANPASTCSPGADGTQVAPVAVAVGGWWTGLLCADGHTAWSALTVKGNRTFTIEVTAEDEQGFVSTAKAMPVIGVWNTTDAVGSLPGVAAAGEAFNGEASGMTTLTIETTQSKQLRVAIEDERGSGRPDFNYQARVLYADALTPASVPATGGTITITGTGFRTGNAVSVNGVAATVTSWSATTIVATAPSLHALGSSSALVADVEVDDLSSGGTAAMKQALTYGTPVASLNLVSAPTGSVIVGQQASVPFAVQVLAADGVTPVVGEAVTFTAASGVVVFGACGGAACTLVTDARGMASTLVTPEAVGAVTIQASGVDGTVVASFQSVAPPPNVIHLPSAPSGTVFVGDTAAVPFAVQVLAADGVTPVAGQAIVFTATGGMVQFGACGAATCTVSTDASGAASTTVTPLTSGTITLSAAAGTAGTKLASINAVMRVQVLSPTQPMVYIAAGATINWTLQLTAADNSAATTGVIVDWQAASGPVVLSPSQSAVNAQGIAQSIAAVGPLNAGAQAVASACAWTAVCASFTAQGVALSELQLQVVSGANQIVSTNGTLAPVTLRVMDTSSHPVAGAVVQIYQTVSEWEAACPDRGRCPIAPVLASSISSATSDTSGLISFTPQQIVGVAGVTDIVAVTGTQGVVSLSLQEMP